MEVPAQRTRSGSTRNTSSTRTSKAASPRTAAQRAYARRDDRLRRIVGGRVQKQAAPAGRAQFVLLVMVLLAVGLVATLWLSTAAAADSYRLQDARTATRDLSEQSELLRKQVAALDASPALAQRATDLGMVPSKNPARLVVGADGAVTLVGEPSAAQAPPPPPAPPAPPTDPNAQAQTPPPADAGAAGVQTPPPADAGAQNPGAQTAGAQTAGAQTAGAQTAGAQNPGTQAQAPVEPPAGTNAATEDAQSQADAGTTPGGAG
ncbi:MAG: hypothetical protein EKK42_07300 [Pseudonocardiaceae bacterium]|nr:MAG: hypothetical protein EKK42_07300 [Pseudonocardiaceae bacterium]